MADELFPIVSTRDLERALSFYRDVLGGSVSYSFPDDGEPQYVGLAFGASALGISPDPAVVASPSPRPISLWVYVDDCDEVVERVRASGHPVVEEPVDQPWGERVARVRDPDGNDVLIGQRGPG